MVNQVINELVSVLGLYTGMALLPIMCAAFVIGIVMRWVIYFTVKCEYNFTVEFEKRVHKYLAREGHIESISSFHQLVKRVLETTYYEIFELKKKFHRRRFDRVTMISDRLFLIQEGVARFIRDTLSQTKYLKKEGRHPHFLEVSKFVYQSNPVFNRVFGVFPMGLFNDLLNILPGLFVISGIFGTFMGIMAGLPDLSNLDINNVEASKIVMDKFLLNMAFSMRTSGVGIFFSLGMTIINAIFSPDSIYINAVNKFTSSLDFLWNDTQTNEIGVVTEEATAKIDRRQMTFANNPAKAGPPVTSGSGEEPAFAEGYDDPLAVESSYDPQPYDKKIRRDPTSKEKEVRDLESRLMMLEAYMKLAGQDFAAGIISPSAWEEKKQTWLRDKLEIEQRLASLSPKPKAA